MATKNHAETLIKKNNINGKLRQEAEEESEMWLEHRHGTLCPLAQ
jgi:hypothetical protein